MTALTRQGFAITLGKRSSLCPVRFCRRGNHRPGDLCSKHKMEAWRAKNPIPARMTHTRESAKKRGIPFRLDLEQFQSFCIESALLETGLTIDRKDARKGYEPGNLQALSIGENAAKGNRERWQQWKGNRFL